MRSAAFLAIAAIGFCLEVLCLGPAAADQAAPADAASALGVPEVKAGTGANRCIWTPKEYKAGAGELTVQIEGANDSAKMTGRGSAVSGVGDEALSTVVGSAAVLHVRKGSTWFVVSVHGVPVDKATEVEKTVAEAIVGKL